MAGVRGLFIAERNRLNKAMGRENGLWPCFLFCQEKGDGNGSY